MPHSKRFLMHPRCRYPALWAMAVSGNRREAVRILHTLEEYSWPEPIPQQAMIYASLRSDPRYQHLFAPHRLPAVDRPCQKLMVVARVNQMRKASQIRLRPLGC